MKVNQRRNHKKNSKRLVTNIIFIFVLLCIYGIGTSFDFGKKAAITDKFIVSHSDTIWNIASGICSEKKGLNIQNIIIEIKEINHLKNSDIYVGQVLDIPVY
ncbi:MAG: LysM peptidoglycan-binding domain-containing protein [Clostridia bacterium]|nr:LysM peptidoglycan-binding domain-containing protein [Clostridia bacterium]